MHRRQTLATSGDSSSIPVPSTAGRHRQSLAPKAGRPSSSQPLTSSQQSQPQSSQGYYNAPATVARGGSTYGAGSVPLGWSGARGDAGNLRSSYAPATAARRTSVYAGPSGTNARRQSTFPGGVAATPGPAYPRVTSMKDPRPVKDRNFLKNARDDISEFLAQRGYPQTLTDKTLTQPTTRDFQEIFRFIYGIFDGKAASTLEKLKTKFEDEVPQLLRSAGYPFASDISKSHLQAIGAQHSWPGMLAMLHFFVQLVKAREESFLGYQDIQIDPSSIDSPDAPSQDNYRTAVWAEYLSLSYRKYLQDENYDPATEKERERLESRYAGAGEGTKYDILRSTEELEKLNADYKLLSKETSNFEKFKQEQKKLDRDLKNMEEYLSKLDKGSEKNAVKCDEFRKKMLDLEQQEKAAMVERKKLAKTVEEQNLSEVDIHRLTSDRQDLDSKLRTAKIEKEDKSRRAYDLEIRRTQAYNVIEKLVGDYDGKATKLGLLPDPPEGYEHINFHQEINGAAATPTAMVQDLTSQIKPAISRLKQDTMASRHEEEEKVMGVEEDLAELKDRITTKYAECEETETRYKNLTTELNNAKDSLATYMQAAQAELDRLDKQCIDLKTETSGGLELVDQRLQALRNEYEKRVSDVEKLRRDNQEAFAQQLESLINYKDYIGGKISELKMEVAA